MTLVRARRLVATDPRNPPPTSLATRSVMRANRGRDTGPERVLRQGLRAAGLRGYRISRRVEGVRPDVVFGRSRVAVFVHGCFWHRCPTCSFPLPSSNRDFWKSKFSANRKRDARTKRSLQDRGWTVITVWSHEVDGDVTEVVARIARVLAALRNPRGSARAQ